MHPVVEESTTLVTITETHKPLHHDMATPTHNVDTSKIVKISRKVQKQLKMIYENHSICLEEINFANKKRLGHGAFCDVYAISVNQQNLAMKQVSPKPMAYSSPQEVAGTVTDLAKEAALLATTTHKNIVKMHGISPGSLLEEDSPAVVLDDDKKGFFILLDRLKTTLDKKIVEWKNLERITKVPAWRVRRKYQQRRDRLMDRLEVALDMARGLQYLHEEKNIVHCDIKPENVGFDENGVLKLFDFGLAMKLKHEKDTIQGMAGTRSYMAPEIHLNQSYGKKVDVFAFAITLWQLCALQSKPIYELSIENDSSSIMIDGVRSLEDRLEMERWWPVELRELMEKCWSGEASERPSWDDIIVKIEKLLEEKK